MGLTSQAPNGKGRRDAVADEAAALLERARLSAAAWVAFASETREHVRALAEDARRRTKRARGWPGTPSPSPQPGSSRSYSARTSP